MRRIVAAAALMLGSLVSMASPASAVSGPWSVVSAGGYHTCAITTGKSLYCWGQNVQGQVGDGTTTNRPSPTKIGAGGIWANVSAGQGHTCAVTTGRSLYCWGQNQIGQVGNGTSGNVLPSPTRIGAAGVWASSAAGGNHSCALTTTKSLYCWGNNAEGELGDGTTSTRVSPRRIGSAGVWGRVNAGTYNTCAISTGNSLYCWGFNVYGQIGDGTSGDPRLSPRKVGTSGAWALVDTADAHTCAITTGKSLYCWGFNITGQLGTGSAGFARPSPTKIGTSGAWTNVSAGGDGSGNAHTCATTTGSSMYCWGNNSFGELGDGTVVTPRPALKKVGASGVWAVASAGNYHSCAISVGNALYCWGYNAVGTVGDGTTTNPRPLPIKIP